jgi:hypothetical protein
MVKLNNIQYWVLVIVCAAIGTGILLKKARLRDEQRELVYLKSANAYKSARTADHTVDLDKYDSPPPPAPAPEPEIYEVQPGMGSVLNTEALELIENPAKLRIFMAVLMEEINEQEQLINIAQKKAPTPANLNRIFAKQKNIDIASARLAAIPQFSKHNGFSEFLTAEKAYLVHQIKYRQGDDLAVINYANGVRRYYLTLMHRAV